MKKILIQFSLLLLPVFVFAQSETQSYKDFSKKIVGIDEPFRLTDHASVMVQAIDDENFELVAIDDKMQVLWRTTLKGVSIGAGLFKGRILVVSASGTSPFKGLTGPFTGFLLDAQTGKLQVQKTIYDSNPDTQELPRTFFNSDGSDFKLVIRQTNASRSFPFMASLSYNKNLVATMETKDFTIITLDDRLDVTTLKPKIPDGYFLNMKCNNRGDLFISAYLENKNIKIFLYEKGKIDPSEITQAIDLVKPKDDLNAAMGVSQDDGNIIYYAQVHNNQNNERELSVIKFDFNNHTSTIVNEVFDKSHIKNIEKSYVPLDKTLDKPEIKDANNKYNLGVRHIEENHGSVLVTLSNSDFGEKRNFDESPFSLIRLENKHLHEFKESSLVINGYDVNLNPKLQQVLAVHYYWEQPWTAGYHIDNNSFYVVANTTQPNHFSVCAQLDLKTGKWIKIEKLPFERNRIASNKILWFKNSFIIPSIERVGMLYPQKENINLSLNSY